MEEQNYNSDTCDNITNTNELSLTFGPSLPPHLTECRNDNLDKNNDIAELRIGPFPQIPFNTMSSTELELSKRALEFKLQKYDQNKSKLENPREEWMLKLPDVPKNTGAKSSFETKNRPDFTDRSCWTDIGNEVKKTPKKEINDSLKNKIKLERDAEQEYLAKKYKKKSKRNKSLLQICEDKRKKDKDKKEKKKIKERRPFCRESDLQINRFDSAKKSALIKKAQLLDTKFFSGETKYL